MISLEQVKLLETKVTKTIDFVKKVTEENAQLRGKLDSYQKRIEELEVLIQRFKEDQSRIEDGILSALDRLNQFEDAVEGAISGEGAFSAKSKHVVKDTPLQTEEPAPVLINGPELPAEEMPAAESSSPGPLTEEGTGPLCDDGGELDIF